MHGPHVGVSAQQLVAGQSLNQVSQPVSGQQVVQVRAQPVGSDGFVTHGPQ
jgi:hypothetical protein